MGEEWLEHLCPEVVEIPWQGRPLQVRVGLPHIRVVGVVRRIVVVLARKVEVVCNSVELFTVVWNFLKIINLCNFLCAIQ